jgi:ABC-type metal ion transport system, periplasmic component/surface adhesin
MIGDINKILILVLLLLAPLLCGCISQNELPSGKINVATTIAPLGDFITAVGGDKVEVTVLVPPGAEPHTYEPTPSQMKDVALADLYIMNGGGLEFWMDKVLQVNKKMLVVDSSQGVKLVNESGGETDPHIWISLRNAAIQVNNICSALIQVDPANKDYYLKNRDDYLQKLKTLDEELNRTFAAKSGRIFIVYHPAWTYFARDYNLDQVPILENEKEPGPKYLGSIIDLARRNNITVIFIEPQYNPKSAEVIAQEIKARVVALDPLGQNYLENMRYAGQEIAKSLK